MTNEQLAKQAIQIRRNIVKMVANAKSGHPGGSLSAVEIMQTIYDKEMHLTKENVKDTVRNKFVLSKGHASPVLYATLSAFGFIDEEELMTFRKINTRLQGHPNMNYVDAVDMSTGSLGQGISTAVGMALSNKIRNNDYRVHVLLGDGECEEGQVWEAAMAAAHYELDNLVAVLDFNGLQIDGDIKEVMNPTPFDKKFEAFGWNVIEVLDGHDYDALSQAFEAARACKGKPSLILAHTVKGKGISYMENNAGWHGSAPNAEQLEIALNDLGGND